MIPRFLWPSGERNLDRKVLRFRLAGNVGWVGGLADMTQSRCLLHLYKATWQEWRGMRMTNCNRFGTDRTDTSVFSGAARNGGGWSDRSVGSQPTSRNPIKRHNKYQSCCRRVWRPRLIHWTRSGFQRPTECILVHAREIRVQGKEWGL